MNNQKKEVSLCGMVALPVTVGTRAILISDSSVIRTTPVVAIHEQSPEQIRFETLNTHYCVSLRPYPLAEVSPIPVGVAA